MDDSNQDIQYDDVSDEASSLSEVSKADKDRVKIFKLRSEVRNSLAGTLDMMVEIYGYQISEVIAEIITAADELEKEFKA